MFNSTRSKKEKLDELNHLELFKKYIGEDIKLNFERTKEALEEIGKAYTA